MRQLQQRQQLPMEDGPYIQHCQRYRCGWNNQCSKCRLDPATSGIKTTLYSAKPRNTYNVNNLGVAYFTPVLNLPTATLVHTQSRINLTL
jgi:hypothetical protein